MVESSNRASSSRRGRWWLLIGLLAVLGGTLAGWYWLRGRGFSPGVARELVVEKDLAIALLENGEDPNRRDDLAQAIAKFETLRGQLPDELLPVRNLAIARLLSLEHAEPAVDAARDAVNGLLEREPDSPVPPWLAAKVVMKMDADSDSKIARAIEILQEAAGRWPDDVVLWYGIFDVGKDSLEDTSVEAADDAVGKAYALAPQNLHLMAEWINVQARRRDPQIVESLKAARETLEPLQRLIMFGANLGPTANSTGLKEDILQMVDDGIAAAERGDWSTVSGIARVVRHGVVPLEVAVNDLNQIRPHPLEFVLFDFSEEFYQRNPPARPPEKSIELRLVRLPDDRQPPAGGEVRDTLVLDYDLDGLSELVVLHDAELVVYDRPSPEAGWNAATRFALPAGMQGLCAADLDYDRVIVPADAERVGGAADGGEAPAAEPRPACHEADSDLIVFGRSGALVLRNEVTENGRRFVEVPQRDLSATGVLDAVLVDFDHDADLDVVLSTRDGVQLWSSLGNLTFEDVSQWSLLPPARADVETRPSTGSLAVVDWDRDGDIDIVAAASVSGVPGYLENLRHGRFRWRAFDETYAPLAASRSIAVLESDGNVSWDLAAASARGVSVLRTTTPRPGVVHALASAQAATESAAGVAAGDVDNDGRQDLLAWDSARLTLLRGNGDGGFSRADSWLEQSPVSPCCAELADLDRDGDLDLVVGTATGVVLLDNDGGNANHWLQVRAVGQFDNRGWAAHTGIGSLLEIKSGALYQAQVVDSQLTHFGLGPQERADVLRIVWTNGVPQAVLRPEADQALCERMTLKGSCPYVYTWTGEKFEFFTDCLWAAPLGMQTALGELAPSRSWEYLKIPGPKLVARRGTYDLQLTEELWEAAYFDHVQLIAVDHPEAAEIYTNEKVGPASIAAPRIHTVIDRRLPVAARDRQGRDVLELLREADGRFFKGWQQQFRQGLTEEHFLELDLGDLAGGERITLFLTGWIYPTNTSLNVAFSRHPELDGPKLPSVWVPDAGGTWREAQAFMGFPGGKTKTIAVDLSQAFLTDDYRLRIVTTAEIYWDAAFFTVDEPEVPLVTRPLRLASGDLHYRGYSRRVPYQDQRPEVYQYEHCSTDPRWPPMRGRFTRYGDVTELLAQADDMMVVLGSGDELTVRFAAPDAPPPPGWRRDFVLHCVGWDKDADLNTYFGQSVEPLPFRSMKRYPYAADESFPATPEHQEYLRTYQTREQPGSRFWRWLKAQRPRGAAVP